MPTLATVLGLTSASADLGPAAAAPPGNEPRLAHDKAVQLAAWALQTPDVRAKLLSPVATLFERVMEAHRQQQAASEKALEETAAAVAAAELQLQRSQSLARAGSEAAAAEAAGGPAERKAAADGEEEEDEEMEGMEGEEAAAVEAEAAAGEGVGGLGGAGGSQAGPGREVDEFDLDFQVRFFNCFLSWCRHTYCV